MRRGNKAAIAVIALCAAAFGVLAGADSARAGDGVVIGPYTVRATTDWSSLRLLLSIGLDLRSAGLSMPTARMEASRMTDRDLPRLAREALLGLRVDSRRDLGDALAEGDIDVNQFLSLLDRRKPLEAGFDASLRTFASSFEVSLRELSALFVRHATPGRQKSVLSYAASRPYTGIVIYAKDPLPLHGEAGEAFLVPCLFPRIWNEDMEPVYERNLASPEAVLARGAVAYASSLSDPVILQRAGEDPLKIMARGAFGDQPTDPVIENDDAVRILSRPENRRLIEEARIVIVISGLDEEE